MDKSQRLAKRVVSCEEDSFTNNSDIWCTREKREEGLLI